VPEQTLVSFVVIAYNEAANIRDALAAITQLDDLGSYEIIVVNDGSDDDTARIVTEIAAGNFRVRLVDLEENRGRGNARRTGIAQSRGELVATVDADIILPRDWLTLARHALAGHDAVGGVAVPDGDAAYLHKRFKLTPRIVTGTAPVTGNNGLYRRAVFEVVNFDAALREGEDSALSHTMRRHGMSCATVPGLLVQHREDKTLATSLRFMFDVGSGATRQLVTFRKVRQPDVVAFGFAAATGLGLFAAVREHRLLGAAIPAGFVVTASIQHVRSRFETPASHWRSVVPAVTVDCAMLMAYFAGRLVGLKALRRGAAMPRPGGSRPVVAP
jgi:hypothetical protein